MKILLIGRGGREHALAWKLTQSPKLTQLYVAPGNAGTAGLPNTQNIDIDELDLQGLCTFAQQNEIALTVVGPEAPLAAGVVDVFTEQGLPCFGPSQQAAQLESSKAFCKDFLARHHIPTANYHVFTALESAKTYLASAQYPLVLKADGLAAGKGVIIAQTLAEALSGLEALSNHISTASQRLVIEDFLQGEEVSFMVITDGHTVLPFASSQDHKALLEGDRGPNTGGMGAYSPAPVLTSTLEATVMERIIHPTLAGLRAEGIYYRGFLYAGLMITPSGEPMVLEYNCRLGDPETQVLMHRLKADLCALLQAACTQTLNKTQLNWSAESALSVVMAAGGYPKTYAKGHVINGLAAARAEHTEIFHAGTGFTDQQITTQGGRVLCVSALGHDLKTAQQRAYQSVNKISWPDAYYRRDIGHRALQRKDEVSPEKASS